MPISTSEYHVEHTADDQVTVRFDKGHHFTLKGDSVFADLSSITAIGVKHLGEVESHTVNTIVCSRSHVIHFVNGAIMRYAYNSTGQLIALSGQNLAFSLSEKNELLFYMR
ncbi:MAG: hypothetical protein WKG03_06575 [Telluria sp.]